MVDIGWHRAFDDPIPVPDGHTLRTLHDVGHYVTALPKSAQPRAEWQAAAEMVIVAAGSPASSDLPSDSGHAHVASFRRNGPEAVVG